MKPYTKIELFEFKVGDNVFKAQERGERCIVQDSMGFGYTQEFHWEDGKVVRSFEPMLENENVDEVAIRKHLHEHGFPSFWEQMQGHPVAVNGEQDLDALYSK